MAESGVDLPRDFAAESDGFAVVFPAFSEPASHQASQLSFPSDRRNQVSSPRTPQSNPAVWPTEETPRDRRMRLTPIMSKRKPRGV
jgi:hypothetical protein